ncbi:hypothetical protein [Clostridium sp. UBA1056]|uniref:hypothetical protein n=1 Tax=unclassified Clostridium TaxID=2614128 RepID=UPI003216D556
MKRKYMFISIPLILFVLCVSLYSYKDSYMIKFLKTGYGILKDELIPSIEKINSEWKIDLPETDNFERLDNSYDGSLFGGASTEVFKLTYTSNINVSLDNMALITSDRYYIIIEASQFRNGNFKFNSSRLNDLLYNQVLTSEEIYFSFSQKSDDYLYMFLNKDTNELYLFMFYL